MILNNLLTLVLSLIYCAPFCTNLDEMPKQYFQRIYDISMWGGIYWQTKNTFRNEIERIGELNKNLQTYTAVKSIYVKRKDISFK
jgi:hypothetical protein